MSDFMLQNSGSISVLTPLTQQAAQWIDDHIDPNAQSWGGGVVIEHRYVDDIVDGIERDGFSII